MNKRSCIALFGSVMVGLLLGALTLIGIPALATPAAGVLYAGPVGLTSGACDSWANACELQTALGLAVSGDEIWVKQGVHYPGLSRTDTFTLVDGVALYGGFAGGETSRDQRDWATHLTILSGDIDQNDLDADGNFIAEFSTDIQGENSYHVVTGSGVGNTLTLDGFIITAGQASDGGGGMVNHDAFLQLQNITFSGNTALVYGGAMSNGECAPLLTNVTFSGNSAQHGGAMANANSSPVLNDVIFRENHASMFGGGMVNAGESHPALTDVIFTGNSSDNSGGGMMNSQNNNPILTNVLFSGNSAANYGGGMTNLSRSHPSLTEVTFENNTAGGEGGGMYNQTASPSLTHVTFNGNSALEGGGMSNWDNSNPALKDVVFEDNRAGANNGGGMANLWSNPTLVDIIFSGNSADNGGGLFNGASSPTLTNVAFHNNSAITGGGMVNSTDSHATLTNITFSGNSASQSGGGMYNYSSNPTLSNVILWDNSAVLTGTQIYNAEASTPTIAYSLVEGSSGSGVGWDAALGVDGGGNLDAHPLFVDVSQGNLRLRFDSPAIDAGDNTADLDGAGPGTTTISDLLTDLDGGPRRVDSPLAPDTGLGSAPLVDMGAYEAHLEVGLVKGVSPSQAAPGQTITYTLTITNGLGMPAAGVLITDTVPSFLTIQAVSFGGIILSDSGHLPPFVWTVAHITPGGVGVITLTAVLTEPLAAGIYTNTATISAIGDVISGNNHSAVAIQVLDAAPQVQNDGYTTLEETSLQIPAPGVLANDHDPNGGAITAFLEGAPAHGLLTFSSDGSFIYTPTLNYAGADSFTYRASDGDLDSDLATVDLTITQVNDAPAGTNKTVTTPEDTPYTLGEADFGFRDPSDTPKDHFSRVKVATLPGKGTLSLDGVLLTAGQFVTVTQVISGLLVFTPAVDGNGAPYTSFTFQVEDDGGTANGGVNLDPTPNTLAIQVTPVNDAPRAFEDSFIAYQDVPLMVNMPGLLANDVDVDTHKDSLSTILDSDPAHGVLTYFYPDGTFLYTPAAGYFGPDSFTYYVTDGELNSNVVTVTITVYRRLFLPLVNR